MARLTPGLASRLARWRRLARGVLWFELAWPALAPVAGVVVAFLILALLDVPARLPAWPRWALPVVALLAAGGLSWWGFARLRRPSIDQADRRLERDTGLRHRPLAALQDRPAGGDGGSAGVWALYQARLSTQVARLRLDWPRPGLARRDRRGVRFLASLGLVVAVVLAGAEAPGRVLRAAWPPLPDGAVAAGTVVQAWVTPPRYTGLPPLVLRAGVAAPAIPTGSHLTISVTGGRSAPSLVLADEASEFVALDGASWQAERDVVAPGVQERTVGLSVRRGGEVAGWALHVLPDLVPTAAFVEAPGAVVARGAGVGQGRQTTRTRLVWRAQDDYGLNSVQAELRLHARPDAPPLVVKGAMAGTPKQARGVITQDLTAHPWAGLPVDAVVAAVDGAGQRGASDVQQFVLPERAFTHLAAQAVIAVRKQLSLTPDERQGAKAALDALADQPALFEGSAKVELALRGTGALLLRGRGQAAIDEAQARLWVLALSLEEGSPDRTAEALAQARQEARDAMEAARQDPADPAAKAELDKKLEALRDAIRKHIDALVEQARREGTEVPLDPNQPQMNARDLDRMAQRAEQAAREGRMDDAKQQMAELEQMLQQLQNARPEHGEQREQRRAERRQQGQDQVSAAQDMVQREGGLLDRSRSRAPDGRTPDGRVPDGKGPDAKVGDQRARDQKAQQAMRRALGELMQRFGDLTGQVPAPLGEADTAMREAGQALADGREADAGAAQQRAIEALQKGSRSMGQQVARQFGRGQQPGQGEGEGEDGQEMGDGSGDGGLDGDGQNGDGRNGSGQNATGNRDGQGGQRPGDARRRSVRRDPLGRPLPYDAEGAPSADGEGLGSQPIPTDQEQARARDLQDELRRRGADRTRPQPELDYIDRLLKAF